MISVKLIFESPIPKMRLEKNDPDSYSIYLGNEEIGFAYCKNYYRPRERKLWNVRVSIDYWHEDGVANSVNDIKTVALDLYDKAKSHITSYDDLDESIIKNERM